MKNLIRILLIAGILLLLNLLSRDYFFRWDVTKDKQYTLSNATRSILKEVNEPITVTAYFTRDLPQQLVKTREDFRDLLNEYSTRSRGLINYEFVDPGDDPLKEQEAQQNGISPLLINVREKDESVQKRAFLGAVIKSETGQDILPLIQPEGPMEYQLTTAIKKLSQVEKPSVGLIQGHGEPNFQDLAILNQSLSILYSVEPVNLDDEGEVAPRFKTLMLINPRDSIPPAHFQKLDNFLDKGGDLTIAFNAVDGDFQTAQGRELVTGLVDWLSTKGLNVDRSFAIDARCGQIQVQQRQGFFTVNTSVQFPYFPLVSDFEDHPITEGLEQVIFQFASPINYTPDSNTNFVPIVKTSESSGTSALPTFFDVQRNWRSTDFTRPFQTIGGVLSSTVSNGEESNIVVFTDGDFPLGSQGRGQNPDNVSLLSNSIDWLSDDTGLIDLRTKGVATRPIKEMEDAERTRTKWLNFLLPIILVIGYGIIRIQRNRRIRIRRMEERI